MNLTYSKPRSVNSYKNFVGTFSKENNSLKVDIDWFIDNKKELSRSVELPIINKEIYWVGSNFDVDVREYFNRALKLLAFG